MKLLISFAAGFLTGLAIYQGPKLISPWFQDQPETPAGHKPRTRYWNGGKEVTVPPLEECDDIDLMIYHGIAVTAPDTGWPLGYRTARPSADSLKGA